jgi:hypothetical protein
MQEITALIMLIGTSLIAAYYLSIFNKFALIRHWIYLFYMLLIWQSLRVIWVLWWKAPVIETSPPEFIGLISRTDRCSYRSISDHIWEVLDGSSYAILLGEPSSRHL